MNQNRVKEEKPFLTIWSFLRNVAYLFIVLILAFVVLNQTDQARDFVLAFVDGSNPSYYISVAALLIFWSYITWYSACIILEISPVNYEFIDEKLAERFCLFIGFAPSLIMAITFFLADYISPWHRFVFGVISISVGILCMVIFKLLDNVNSAQGRWPSKVDVLKHNTNNKGAERTPSLREEIKFVFTYSNVAYYFKYLGIFFLALLFLLCFTSPLIWISRSLMPAAVVILCFTFLTYFLTVFYYFHDMKARPFVIFILIWLLFCSRWNDNTKIPMVSSFKDQQDFRLTPKAAFDKWYLKKMAAWKTDSVHSKKLMPVIFIATEGGGIRGEIWTSEVLHELRRSFPNFYEQVFCIGGASGGTVGAVYYNSFVYDSLNNQRKNPKINFDNYIKFAQADCISPVIASFVFGENLQRMWPFPIASLERSKVMMNAFSKSYYDHLQSGLADSSFLSLYYPNDDSTQFNCDIPSLFINGTLAETGQRIITSNLKIKDIANFKSDIDFFDKVKGHITIATASLNCMRFPLLLSGGLITKVDSKGKKYKIGHLIDGGYRENSGLQAMYSLMTELYDNFKGKPVKPILIYIRNGGMEYDPDKENTNSAIKLLHDIGTPVTGVLNVNGTSVPAFGIMQMMTQQEANGNPFNMYYNQIWLKDPGYKPDEKFPLGLYISDSAFFKIRKRAEQITTINKDLMDILNLFFK